MTLQGLDAPGECAQWSNQAKSHRGPTPLRPAQETGKQRPGIHSSVLATRKPVVLYRLPKKVLLRNAERMAFGTAIHAPPRTIR